MLDYSNLQLIPVGVFVRRDDSAPVSIWLTLSKPAQIGPRLWTDNVFFSVASASSFSSNSAQHTNTVHSICIRDKLYLVVIILGLSTSPDIPGQIYSFNLVITVGSLTGDLNELRLWEERTLEPQHLAIIDVATQLPGFAMPSASLEKLQLVQAS